MAERTDKEKNKDASMAILGAGLGVAGAGLLSRKGPAGTDLSALLAIIEEQNQTLANLVQAINDLLAALGGGGTVLGYPPNADYAIAGSLDLTVALTPARLPLVPIPDGFGIAIKSHPVNGIGILIYVAKSAGEATNPNTSWPLVPNEAIIYMLKNGEEIWVSATIVPAIVVWTVEQRR